MYLAFHDSPRGQVMERTPGLFGLADYVVATKRRQATFLDGISAMINWKPVEKLLKRGLGRTSEITAGAKSYPAVQMFRVLLLQQWYNLSDQDTEAVMCDRLSFIRFVGFSLEESVPDHTTICRFRNLLVAKKLLEPLLNEINRQLEIEGKLVKKGVAVDASIITSAARPRKRVDVEILVCDREEAALPCAEQTLESVSYSHDRDASWTKKGKEFHYGYKAHTSVDVETGLVLAGHVTPANHSDTGELAVLVKESRLPVKSRVYADKGYTSANNRKILKQYQCKDGIMHRAYRNKPLTVRERNRNKLISKKRFIVERVIGTLKHHYNLARASYLGTAKVQGELLLACLAYNLKRALSLLPLREKCAQ
jgi:IS5 family transposase